MIVQNEEFMTLRNLLIEERRRVLSNDINRYSEEIFTPVDAMYSKGALIAYYAIENSLNEKYDDVVLNLSMEENFPYYLTDLIGALRKFEINEVLLTDTPLPIFDIISALYDYNWKIVSVDKYLLNKDDALRLKFVTQPVLRFKCFG